MSKLSKDILDDIEAQNAIQSIEDAKELQAFVKGEQRDSMLDLAAFRLNLLKGQPKQGEQDEPFTKPADNFKEGIQGTKQVDPEILQSEIHNPKSETLTGEHVVEAIDKASEQKADEIVKQAAEEPKPDAPKNHISGEDVIKGMRERGISI